MIVWMRRSENEWECNKAPGVQKVRVSRIFSGKNFLFYDILKRRKFLMQFYLNGIAGRLCFPA